MSHKRNMYRKTTIGKKTKVFIGVVCSAVLVGQVLTAGGTGYAVGTGTTSDTTNGTAATSSKAAVNMWDQTEDRTYDVRKAAQRVLPTQVQLDAATSLIQSSGNGLKIQWDSLFGTPSMIYREKGFVSGPATGDAVTIAKNWLKQNAALFGLSAADVDAMNVVRDYAMPGTGLHPVTLQQTVNGIESVYGGRIIVAVAKDGRVLTVTGNARPSGQLAADFAMTPADALSKAISLLVPGVTYTPQLVKNDKGWDVFAGGSVFPTDQRVKKSVFLTGSEIRPAYRVLLIEKLNQAHEAVIDAATGEKLYQRSLVDYLEPHGLIFENYPGAEKGGTQELRSFAGDTAASPNGWTLPAGNLGITTIGNNADSYANWSNFLVPEGTGAIRPVDPLGQFNYTFFDAWRKTNGQTVPPSYAQDMESAVTNLFYHHNLFHDYFYKLGWIEAAGNLQVNNFGKGGSEGDPVLGMAHAGALSGGSPTYTGRDNAYMLTLPDGIPAWSGMFLWEPIPAAFEAPYADGDFDASVIYHEYTHALSQRMVAGGESLNSHQAGSMGEAWSDWYAMNYLVSKGYETEPIVGKYVTGNKERGIRDWSLSQSPLNFSDIGFDIVGPEVHADGEIWAAILWHVRQQLINQYGAAEGVAIAEQLVMDAMPISKPDPSMADMRAAIIAADVLRYNGAHYDTLWSAFAQRGLGFSASSQGGDDLDPVPGFDHPNAALNGKLTAKVINADTGTPVADARAIIGQFEARTSAAANTSDKGMFSLPMVDATYDITIQAKGYGSRTIQGVQIASGKTKSMTIKLAPNLASDSNGAQVTSVSSQSDSNPAKNVIDDTEATVFASQKDSNGFKGAELVVDLAGDQPMPISQVQISAFKDVAKSRFSALKDFTLQVSNDSATWTTVLQGTFPTQKPRPVTPDLHYKSFDLATSVKAKYVKLIADHAQSDTLGEVQIADLQVFSGKKANIEPLTVEPEQPFTAQGTIQVGNPGTGIGSLADLPVTLAVTQNEFVTTQNPQPVSQGVDGYVVTLPGAYADGIHNVLAVGPGDGSYDLDVYFYDKNFNLISSKATSGADESAVIPGGTRYIYVGLYSGTNVPFTLTAKN